MKKNQPDKQYQHLRPLAPIAAILLFLIASSVGSMTSLFGMAVSADDAPSVVSYLSLGCIIFGIWMFIRLRAFDMRRFMRGILVFISYTLLIVGWRFAAGPPDWSGNDGYTVTGGFLMLLSGIIIGWLLATNKSHESR